MPGPQGPPGKTSRLKIFVVKKIKVLTACLVTEARRVFLVSTAREVATAC